MLGPIEILVILLVAGGVLFVLIRNSSTTRGKVLLTLAGFAAVMVFALRSYRNSDHSSAMSQLPDSVDVVVVPVSHWANLEHQQFLADFYPSKEAAAIPLARQVRAAIDDGRLLGKVTAEAEDDVVVVVAADVAETPSFETEESSSTVSSAAGARRLTTPKHLMLHDNSAGKTVLQKFAGYLRSEFPISEVRSAQQPFVPRSPPAKIENDGVRIVLTTVEEHIEVAASNQPLRQVQGKLVCEITTAKGTATISANYIDKLWVENLDRFVSTQSSWSFVVGYSTKLASSEAEARRMAVDDAKRNLSPQIGSLVTTAVIESLLVDRFAQKLSRPYGDVWREAILLDTSNERIAPLIATARRQAVVQQTQHTSLVRSLAVLFAVAAATCIALNLLTQGYYRGPLLAGLAVVVGVLMLVA